MTKASLLGVAVLAASATMGCAGKPAPPFDTLKTANLTAFRLQNYEPPAAAAAAPAAPASRPRRSIDAAMPSSDDGSST